jgi:polysaccharide export outer membrane protein
MGVRLKCDFLRIMPVVVILGFGVANASAQYAGPAISSPAKAATTPESALKVEYPETGIMPGDVISISVLGAPELNINAQSSPGTISSSNSGSASGIRVGQKGEVVLAYLGAVKLAGLTPSQASIYLAKALQDGGFLVDPQVSVQLLDSPTRIITVIGEVQRPTPVPAFGQLRLLDVISTCGGLTPLASHTLTVRRPGQLYPIMVDLGADPKAANVSNIPLMAGDTLIVPKVGSVFVVGQVKTQGAIPLSGNSPITVMRAISMAGGVNFGAALSRVRIIRPTADNRHIEIMLDLKKVMYGKQQDIALASDDVLFIPSSVFKASLAAGGATVASTLLYESVYTSTVLK